FDASENAELILFVGDAEARVEVDLGSVRAQQVGAKGVNRSAGDARGGRGAESALNPAGDLTRGFVRECEGADARRIEVMILDQEANALGETVRLARAGAREDEQRARVGLDSASLGRR